MLKQFAAAGEALKLKDVLGNRTKQIDNLGFRFHYRATFAILFVCTILVTSRCET